MNGDPRIAVLRSNGAVIFTLFMTDPGDEEVAGVAHA